MDKTKYAIPEVQDGPQFSKLASTLVTTELPPRAISRDGAHVFRHAEPTDLTVDELDFDYDVDTSEYPFANIDSTQELLSGVLYNNHLRKSENFMKETNIDCLMVQKNEADWLHLDDDRLRTIVKAASERCVQVPALSTSDTSSLGRQALIFFVPLVASKGASYQWATSISQSGVTHLFDSLRLNPAFLLNMLGRPDYWAPQTLWNEDDGSLLGLDFFCQHPRWNLQAQGAPLSIYSKYDAQRDLTVYIVSHKPQDTVVRSLRALLDITVRHPAHNHMSTLLLDSPMDLQVIIANLNFESSKWHVKRFQRLQWSVVNKVDDHLAGIEARDRSKLAALLKDLQVMAQNVDSHLANAEIFGYGARAIRDACLRLSVSKRARVRQRTIDTIRHVITCMEKQNMWFLNYKGRKDATMNLLFHITTQQDALNNIELASDMKKDSTSMNAIAGLTMVFLPGTFTAVCYLVLLLYCRTLADEVFPRHCLVRPSSKLQV